jgi:cysteine desulfurase
MPGVEAEQQLIALDLAGIAVSAGSACSSGKVEPSHVLAAMGIEAEEAATAIRVSMGWSTTEQDVERFCAAWDDVRAKAQGKKRTAA